MSACPSKYLGRWRPAETRLQGGYGFLYSPVYTRSFHCELYAVLLPSNRREDEQLEITAHIPGVRRFAINTSQIGSFAIRLPVYKATYPAGGV